MSIRNQRDFCAGILFAAVGIFAIVVAQENPLGSAARMGPAYFPTLLGICLVALGLVCALLGYFRPTEPGDDGKVQRFGWKILFFIFASIAIFCVVLQYLGLLLSMAIMIGVCSLASPESKWRETIVLMAVLDLICWTIFVYIIGMAVPALPWFI